MRRFSGFMSRWKKPFLCIFASPLAIWKIIFLSKLGNTWFIFRWSAFPITSFSNIPHTSCSPSTRKPYTVPMIPTELPSTLLCCCGWVSSEIWSIAVKCINSNLNTFASFSLSPPIRLSLCWSPCKQSRMHRLRGSWSFCIFTSLLNYK